MQVEQIPLVLINTSSLVAQLCCRLNNESIRLLSLTPLWNEVKKLAEDQFWWYLRSEYLTELKLQVSLEVSWKNIYYLLKSAILDDNLLAEDVLSNPIVVEILYDMGYNPSYYYIRDN